MRRNTEQEKQRSGVELCRRRLRTGLAKHESSGRRPRGHDLGRGRGACKASRPVNGLNYGHMGGADNDEDPD